MNVSLSAMQMQQMQFSPLVTLVEKARLPAPLHALADGPSLAFKALSSFGMLTKDRQASSMQRTSVTMGRMFLNWWCKAESAVELCEWHFAGWPNGHSRF